MEQFVCQSGTCGKMTIELVPRKRDSTRLSSVRLPGAAATPAAAARRDDRKKERLWPKHLSPTLPAEVPEPYSGLYTKAFGVLDIAPEASAALSRTCLQRVLREHYKIKAKPTTLESEIDEFVKLHNPPSDLAERLHQAREVGNFALHPSKSSATGQIVEVEAGEAEWNLETLDDLFDYAFAKPAREARRREAWEQKKRGMPTT